MGDVVGLSSAGGLEEGGGEEEQEPHFKTSFPSVVVNHCDFCYPLHPMDCVWRSGLLVRVLTRDCMVCGLDIYMV